MNSDKIQLWTLCLVVFIGYLGITLPLPIYAPLFIKHLDFRITTLHFNVPPELILGLVLFAYPFGQALGNPFLGRLSDHVGRKPTLIFTMSVISILYLVSAALIYFKQLPFLFISRLLTGIFEGNISIARAAAIDISDRINIKRSISYINMSMTSGYILGPILGGLCAESTLFKSLHYAKPFILASLISFCVTIILVMLFRETLITNKPRKPLNFTYISSIRAYLSTYPIGKLIISGFMITLGLDIFYQFFPLFLVHQWNYGPAKIAYLIMLIAICSSITNGYLINKYERWIYKQNSICILIATLALVLCLVIIVTNPIYLYWLMPIIGLCVGILPTVMIVSISNAYKIQQQGELMGVINSLRLLGDSFICILGGIIGSINYKLPMVFSIVVLFISLGRIVQQRTDIQNTIQNVNMSN